MFEVIFSVIGLLIGFSFTSAALDWWWIFRIFPCFFMAGVGGEFGAAVGRALDRREKEAERQAERRVRSMAPEIQPRDRFFAENDGTGPEKGRKIDLYTNGRQSVNSLSTIHGSNIRKEMPL